MRLHSCRDRAERGREPYLTLHLRFTYASLVLMRMLLMSCLSLATTSDTHTETQGQTPTHARTHTFSSFLHPQSIGRHNQTRQASAEPSPVHLGTLMVEEASTQLRMQRRRRPDTLTTCLVLDKLLSKIPNHILTLERFVDDNC